MLLLDVTVNNYKMYENVESILRYGNPDVIPAPYITIAIPTYQRAHLLRDALNSAVSQVSIPVPYDIIVVDNEANTSGMSETEKVVRSFSSERVLYYRNTKNLGMFGNWNRCVELARGEWIAFLHDDDLLDNDYLSIVSLMLKRKQKIGALIPERRYFKISNMVSVISANFEAKRKFLNMMSKYCKDRLIRINPTDNMIWNHNIYLAPTCGTIFKRRILLDLGGFHDDWFPSSDWFLMFCLNRNYPLYKTIKRLGTYRILENESLNEETITAFFRQQEEFREYTKHHSLLACFMYHMFRYEQHYQAFTSLCSSQAVSSELRIKLGEILQLRRRPIRLIIYNRSQTIYWGIKRVIAMLFG